jgi:hypothetical protein
MATPYKPELFTIDDVVHFYEAANGVNYRVYVGTSPKPQFCRYYFEGDEKEIGAQTLQDALQGLKQSTDNTNSYLIEVFTKPKNKKDLPETTSIIFQLNKYERLLPYMGAIQENRDNGMKELLGRMIETQNLILTKLSQDELEEEEPAKPTGLAGLLDHPEIQNLAVMALSGVIGKFLNPSGSQPAAMAGIPEETEIMGIVNSLMNKGVTIDHLRKLDEMGEMKLKSLLLML